MPKNDLLDMEDNNEKKYSITNQESTSNVYSTQSASKDANINFFENIQKDSQYLNICIPLVPTLSNETRGKN